MPTPIKLLPGQQLIDLFMQSTPNNHAPVSPGTAANAGRQDLRQRPASMDQDHKSANTSANCGQLTRKRRIIELDDDEPLPIAKEVAPPIERITVHDTENESDANFSVVLRPPQQGPLSDPASAPEPESTPRRSQRNRIPAPVSESRDSSDNDDRDSSADDEDNGVRNVLRYMSPGKKHALEGEAEESVHDSDDSFIDDEPDESDSDAQKLARSTCASLRNRRTWKETEFQCPLCADLRAILKLLLKRK
jgi:hypothetical protein